MTTRYPLLLASSLTLTTSQPRAGARRVDLWPFNVRMRMRMGRTAAAVDTCKSTNLPSVSRSRRNVADCSYLGTKLHTPSGVLHHFHAQSPASLSTDCSLIHTAGRLGLRALQSVRLPACCMRWEPAVHGQLRLLRAVCEGGGGAVRR